MRRWGKNARAFWRNEPPQALTGMADRAAGRGPALLYTSHFRQASCVVFIFLLVTLTSVAWGQRLLEEVMTRHVKDMITAEIRARQAIHGHDDLQQLMRQLGQFDVTAPRRERAAAVEAADGRLIYGVAELLAADLCPDAASPCSGWLRSQRHGDGMLHEWLGYAYLMPQGGRYVVAYNILPMFNRLYPVPLVAGLCLFMALLLSLGVGMYSGIDAAKRINRIRAAMAQFAQGATHSRVALLGMQDEFDQLGQDVNAALARISFLMEEVRNASNHIAHELRTPLTRLQQRLSNLAEMAVNDARLAAEVAQAEEEIQHIQYLFRAVMRISEIETGRCRLSTERFDALAFLTDIRDYYGVLAEARDVTLSLLAEPELHISGDRALLFQALTNLLDNAIKYAPAGSAITLLARQQDAMVVLGVADEGPGIEADQRSLAVQRFRRLGRERAVRGHGLGLPLVQAVAALHGGDLLLTDNVGDQSVRHHGLRGLLALVRIPAVVGPPPSADDS